MAPVGSYCEYGADSESGIGADGPEGEGCACGAWSVDGWAAVGDVAAAGAGTVFNIDSVTVGGSEADNGTSIDEYSCISYVDAPVVGDAVNVPYLASGCWTCAEYRVNVSN